MRGLSFGGSERALQGEPAFVAGMIGREAFSELSSHDAGSAADKDVEDVVCSPWVEVYRCIGRQAAAGPHGSACGVLEKRRHAPAWAAAARQRHLIPAVGRKIKNLGDIVFLLGQTLRRIWKSSDGWGGADEAPLSSLSRRQPWGRGKYLAFPWLALSPRRADYSVNGSFQLRASWAAVRRQPCLGMRAPLPGGSFGSRRGGCSDERHHRRRILREARRQSGRRGAPPAPRPRSEPGERRWSAMAKKRTLRTSH